MYMYTHTHAYTHTHTHTHTHKHTHLQLHVSLLGGVETSLQFGELEVVLFSLRAERPPQLVQLLLQLLTSSP